MRYGLTAPQSEERRALAALDSLVQEVRQAHRDKESSDYNQCEEAECMWCAESEAALVVLRAALQERETTEPRKRFVSGKQVMEHYGAATPPVASTGERREVWVCDVRVGTVAVYRGPKVNCLAGMALADDVAFIGSGTWDKEAGAWSLPATIIEAAQHITALLNAATPPVASSGERREVREVLAAIVATMGGECSLDHHGYCQAHLLERDCSVKRARELLETREGER